MSEDLLSLMNQKKQKSFCLLKKKHHKLYVFYPTYKKEKHGALGPIDCASDPKLSMLKNLNAALQKMLSTKEKNFPFLNTENILYRKEKNRVIIHPFSSDNRKAWPLKKYLLLAKRLKQRGFTPLFTMKPGEKNLSQIKEFPVTSSPSLSDLATLIHQSGFYIGNDSGPGHMASLLQIPSIIIADDYKRMKLWKPDYYPVMLITPHSWIPNLKGMRLRKKYWSSFISVSRVFQGFKAISTED